MIQEEEEIIRRQLEEEEKVNYDKKLFSYLYLILLTGAMRQERERNKNTQRNVEDIFKEVNKRSKQRRESKLSMSSIAGDLSSKAKFQDLSSYHHLNTLIIMNHWMFDGTGPII